MPRIPGIDLKGVVKLDNLGDAHNMLKLLKRARNSVVVGGGITALEIVEGIRARGKNVHYFLRGDRYWKSVLDETEAHIVERRLLHEGVKIHYHTEIASISGNNGKVVGIVTKEGKQLRCEVVAFAIGVSPNKKIAESAGFETDRGILVDGTLQASAPDVYAAGDVAQVYDPYTGKTVLDTLWPTARQQGWTAGMNMMGQLQQYRKTVPYNVTRLAGLTTTIIGTVGLSKDDDLIGIARGDSESWRLLSGSIVVKNRVDVNRVRIMLGKNKILGAVVMGDQALSRPLYQLISQKADLSSIFGQFSEPQKLEETLHAFWNKWRSSNANEKL
ncbi:MAG: FAD-dependent oxidoreductase, partial [Anaerolineaceae bacterium]|nr:FAD-dependent oxidoreductase [Anaerolineaceae bacterium]